jgi:small-conductance mechanosensitive channel
VTNTSANQRHRVVLAVSLSAGPDLDLAQTQASLLQALATVSGVQPEPPPHVDISGVTQGKLELRLVFWVLSRPDDAPRGTVSAAVEAVRVAAPGADVARVEASTP